LNDHILISSKQSSPLVKQRNVLYPHPKKMSTQNKHHKNFGYGTNAEGTPYIDQREADFFESFEKEWWGVQLTWLALEKEKKKFQQAAHAFNKKKSISLRILERNLYKIKVKAMKKGIPYQTYINMIINEDIQKAT